ncbi:MAG: hypothetical protein ABR899_10475 [Candidatus Krumholzibacteriaceae bacterium]
MKLRWLGSPSVGGSRRRVLSLLALGGLLILQMSCAVPRMIWPQENIQALELNSPKLDKRVLVAARSSEFKDAVVAKIRDSFMGIPVYVKFIGVDDLEKEKAGSYTAVILVSMCIAGGFDRHIDAFIGRESDQHNIIILTTAGDANWKPDKKGRNYDAITTASIKTDVDKIAGEIISKVRALLAAS